MKVLYIPGILGSSLAWSEGPSGPPHPVWVNLPAILAGELASLQLAADGVSPGPLAQGKTVTAWSIFAPTYGPLLLYMQFLGWDVLPLPYDWRQSHITQAQVLWPAVRTWAAGQPIYVVAHSMGGLLARAIYGQMQAAGLDAQLARIVTLGTPHFGSLESVRLWWRMPTLYRGLAVLSAAGLAWPDGSGPQYLDDVLASMPSWYELQAFAGSGPLWQSFPAQAAMIYQPSFYAGGNAFLNANLLFSAQIAQTQFAGWMPAGRVIAVAGVGERTAYALHVGVDQRTDAGWQYTQQGDSLVTLAQTSPPGVPVYTVGVRHDLLPLHPAVWALVPPLTINGQA